MSHTSFMWYYFQSQAMLSPYAMNLRAGPNGPDCILSYRDSIHYLYLDGEKIMDVNPWIYDEFTNCFNRVPLLTDISALSAIFKSLILVIVFGMKLAFILT